MMCAYLAYFSHQIVRLHGGSNGRVPPDRRAEPRVQRVGGVLLPPVLAPARELLLHLQPHHGPWALSLRHHALAELPHAL